METQLFLSSRRGSGRSAKSTRWREGEDLVKCASTTQICEPTRAACDDPGLKYLSCRIGERYEDPPEHAHHERAAFLLSSFGARTVRTSESVISPVNYVFTGLTYRSHVRCGWPCVCTHPHQSSSDV
jgi:hypothetical protein